METDATARKRRVLRVDTLDQWSASEVSGEHPLAIDRYRFEISAREVGTGLNEPWFDSYHSISLSRSLIAIMQSESAPLWMIEVGPCIRTRTHTYIPHT